MKQRVIKLTESQLEEIIKRVISEQDGDYEPKGGWSPEQKKAHETKAKELYGSVKPDAGGKYCFSKAQDANSVMGALKRNIGNSGPSKKLYKIKKGDTPNKVNEMGNNVFGVNNKSCDIKNVVKVGDVILLQL